jgi:hypothetical protein
MAMQTFFFDVKDGVPMRDRVGMEFGTTIEAIAHSKVLAQHFRDDSLRDDQGPRDIRGQRVGTRNSPRVRSPRAQRQVKLAGETTGVATG